MDSMIRYFKDLLTKGEIPTDPFEDAVQTTPENLSEEEKENLRRAWNNRIAQYYGGEDKMRERMLHRRARRVLKHHRR